MFEQDRVFKNSAGKDIFRAPEQDHIPMTRYRVSGVNDPSEQNAEQMADQVMGGSVFRAPEGVGDAGGEVSIPSADLSGAGSALPEQLQRSMEGSFGASFGNVRVHTDAGADRASRGLSARAFTRGQDMYFRSGAYDPDSFEGQHLIAHELAHVAAGESGLHRTFEKPTFDRSTPDSSLDAAARKEFYNKKKEEIAAGADVIVGGAQNLIADQAKMAIRYTGSSFESFSKAELDASKEKLNDREAIIQAANGFMGDLDAYIASYSASSTTAQPAPAAQQAAPAQQPAAQPAPAAQQAAPATQQAPAAQQSNTSDVEAFCNELKAEKQKVADVKKQCEDKKNDFDAVLELINNFSTQMASQPPEMGEKVEMSADVKEMVTSSWFTKFIEGIETLRNVKLNDSDKQGFDARLEHAAENDPNSTIQPSLQVSGAMEETGLQKAARITGAASSVTGAIGIGSDLVGDAADIASEYRSEEKNKNFAQGASITSVVSGSLSTITSVTDLTISAAQLRQKEAAKNEKMKALGMNKFDQAADHSGRLGVAAKGISAVGGMAGIGSAGASIDGKDTASHALNFAGSVLGFAGDTLGVLSAGDKADRQMEQEQTAKRSVMNMGKQLGKTLPSTGALQPREEKVKAVADTAQINGGQAKKRKEAQASPLSTAIAAAKADDPNLKPELTGKQESILATMLALDASIGNSAQAAKDLLVDVGFGSVSMIADAFKMMSASFKWADIGPIGPILGAIGTLLGAVSGVKDVIGGIKGASESNTERDGAEEKAGTCRTAINHMANLPYLDVSALTTAAKGSGEAAKITRGLNETAEQYAAVYSIIKAGNVEMADILYAIKQGGFDGTQSADDSMRKMYANLTFSNLSA